MERPLARFATMLRGTAAKIGRALATTPGPNLHAPLRALPEGKPRKGTRNRHLRVVRQYLRFSPPTFKRLSDGKVEWGTWMTLRTLFLHPTKGYRDRATDRKWRPLKIRSDGTVSVADAFPSPGNHARTPA